MIHPEYFFEISNDIIRFGKQVCSFLYHNEIVDGSGIIELVAVHFLFHIFELFDSHQDIAIRNRRVLNVFHDPVHLDTDGIVHLNDLPYRITVAKYFAGKTFGDHAIVIGIHHMIAVANQQREREEIEESRIGEH